MVRLNDGFIYGQITTKEMTVRELIAEAYTKGAGAHANRLLTPIEMIEISEKSKVYAKAVNENIVLGDVSNCDLCHGIGYISVDNEVVDCHSC